MEANLVAVLIRTYRTFGVFVSHIFHVDISCASPVQPACKSEHHNQSPRFPALLGERAGMSGLVAALSMYIITGPCMTQGIFTQDKTFQEIQTARPGKCERAQTSDPLATSSDGYEAHGFVPRFSVQMEDVYLNDQN